MNNLEEAVHLLITAAIVLGLAYGSYLVVEAVAVKLMLFV